MPSVRSIFEINKDKIIKWYIVDKLSGVKIQKLLKTKNKKIYNYLHKWGIKVRTKSEALSGRKQTELEIKNRIDGLKKCGKKWWLNANEASKNQKLGKSYEELYGYEKAKEMKEKRSGKNSKWYINGNGKGKYPLEFNESLKNKVKIRDNFQCMDCGIFDSKLHAHHIDFNKQNNTLINLISLCRTCHLKTQFYKPRLDCIDYFKQKMEGLLWLPSVV